MKLPESVLTAIKRLEDNNFEAVVVGGCVRNDCLHLPIVDYDLATNATPLEMLSVFSDYHCIETGAKHGTITVIVDDTPLEITTYRIDGEYKDNRHPESVSFSKQLEDDLSRRDFTINAMAYKPSQGLIDVHNGLNDLQQGIIRCVGNPYKRFDEDALRILRGLRFAAQYGFSIEAETENAMREKKQLLLNISPERIFQEMTKTICGPYIETVMLQFSDIFSTVCPYLKPTIGFNQNNPWHIYTAYEHIVKTVAAVKPDPILRWTMFLHDIGKPECYSEDENGIGHFRGHPLKSAYIAETFLKHLHIDSQSLATITTLIRAHDERIIPTEKNVKRLLNRLKGFEMVDLLLQVQEADRAGQNPEKHNTLPDPIAQIHSILKKIKDNGDCFDIQRLAINGNDCIQAGIPAGPEIGKTLSWILGKVIDGKLENNREILLNEIEKRS